MLQNHAKTPNKRTVWRFGAKIRGVKNRCRKIDLHITDKTELGESDAPNQALAVQKAMAYAKANFKSVQSVVATIKLWEIDPSGCEQWQPFNPLHNKEIRIDLEAFFKTNGTTNFKPNGDLQNVR